MMGKNINKSIFANNICKNEVFNTNTIEKNDGSQLKTVDGKTQNAIIAGTTWAKICICNFCICRHFEDSYI